MPRPGEYTPQRRRLMQLVMLCILGVTIALAAVATRSANRAHRVELSPQTFTHENVTVRLPLQWRAQAGDKSDPRVIAQATEVSPPAGAAPRVVRVLMDRIDRPMSPTHYLRETFGVPDVVVLRALQEDLEPVFATAPVGASAGVLIGMYRAEASNDEGFELSNDIYAAAVLPSLQVIVVHQSGAGEIDLVDEAIVKQIAAAIQVADAAQAEPAQAVVTLAAGIQLQPPGGFVALQKSDTNRTDRLLWRAPTTTAKSAEQLEADWASIEVVGCLFPRGQRDNAAAAIETLLLVRDQSWRGARIAEQGGLWRADRVVTSSDANFPARAYLLPDRSDRALLAILRGGSDGGGAFDQIWKELEATVRFLTASDVGQLESVGSTEAARLLSSAEFPRLFRERDEQWWLCTGPGNRPHIGWSNLKWQPGEKLAAKVETRMRSFGGDVVTRTVGEWNLGDDARKYSAQATRTESRVHQPHTLSQVINLQRGQLTIGVRADTSDAKEFRMRAPPQYIPGGVLPMLIGRLDPGPLLIRTDSFIECEAAGTSEPLSVIIRPGVNAIRKAEGDDKPMRCVTTEVNGSGRVSRWYYNSDGALELVELAGGMTLTPSDAAAINFAFGKGGPMTP